MSLSARALGALSSTSQSPARLSLRARCCMLSLPLVVIVLLVFIVPLHLLHRNRLQPTPRRDCSASVVCCFDFFFFIFRFALLRAPAQRPRASWSGAASVTSGDGSDGHRCGDGTAAAPQSISAVTHRQPTHPLTHHGDDSCMSAAQEQARGAAAAAIESCAQSLSLRQPHAAHSDAHCPSASLCPAAPRQPTHERTGTATGQRHSLHRRQVRQQSRPTATAALRSARGPLTQPTDRPIPRRVFRC